MNTEQQYHKVVAECRKLFAQKLHDYGDSWRILRPSSLTDQMRIKALRIRALETKAEQRVDEDVDNEYIGIVNYAVSYTHLDVYKRQVLYPMQPSQ